MLEIGFVVRAGREQGDVRWRAGRAHGLQAVHHCVVGGGQALHAEGFEGLWKLARNRQAIFEQVAQTRRRLRALRDDPPVAIGAAREVESGDVQPGVAGGLHAVHGPQVARMPADQRGRQQAFRQQLLRTIDVGHHAIEHAHALQHAGFDLGPALGRDDQRKEVERPGALRTVGVGVNVVGDAVVANLPLQADGATWQIAKAARAELFEEMGPGRREGRFRCRFDRAVRDGRRRRAGGIVQNGAAAAACRPLRLRRRARPRRRRGQAAQFVEMAATGRRRERRGPRGRRVLRRVVKQGFVQRFHGLRIVTSPSHFWRGEAAINPRGGAFVR